MAITNFIPTIWSETLYKQLSKTFIAVDHCNREFEGDIKGKGSTVKICGVGNVSLKDYSKNTNMNDPEILSDTVTTLTINKAKCFNFQIDDVDRVQSSPKLMEAALQKAAEAIANDADAYVLSLTHLAGKQIVNTYNSGESFYDTILKAREILYKNNVNDGTELFLEVTPEVAARILKEKIALPSTNENVAEHGYLGSIFGCKIYVTNNLIRTINSSNTSASTVFHNCILRTRRAICFVDQLSEIEAYRPEKRFADAIKGLHLYGANVVYPNEMVAVVFECEEDT